jgi:hypothetical protein
MKCHDDFLGVGVVTVLDKFEHGRYSIRDQLAAKQTECVGIKAPVQRIAVAVLLFIV